MDSGHVVISKMRGMPPLDGFLFTKSRQYAFLGKLSHTAQDGFKSSSPLG